MIKLQYYKEKEFLEIIVSGETSKTDFEYLNEILSDYSEIAPIHNVLVDLSNCRLNTCSRFFHDLINPFKETLKSFDYLMIAELVSKPFETAFSMVLAKELEQAFNIKTNIFCTKRAALNWLGVHSTKIVLNDEKRTRIMQTALELFVQNEYHETSIESITNRLNFSNGSIYNYFKSKDEILNSIIKNSVRQLSSDFEFLETPVEQIELQRLFINCFKLLEANRLF